MRPSWLLIALAWVAAGVFGCVNAGAAEPLPGLRTGVVVTPKNFPDHTPEDVADMFRLVGEVGTLAVIRIPWSDPNLLTAIRVMTDLASQHGLTPVIQLAPFKADGLKGASLDLPRGVSRASGRESFANPAIAEAFTKAALEVAELAPPYLALATDLNLLQQSDPAEFTAFVQVYRDIYERIRKTAPKTRVFVTFQWDAMQQRDARANRALLDALLPRLDVFAFNSDPVKLYERQGPAGIPADYYDRLQAYRGAGEELLVEVSWPSERSSGEADQVAFIRSLPGLLARAKPSMVAWNFLHDVKVLIFTARLGLITTSGTQKPAFAAFRSLGGQRPAPVAATDGPRKDRVKQTPDRYVIATARLDGSDYRIVYSRPDKDMTHARVSPDGSRIVFTGYNKRGKDGLANEDSGYENTEISVLNLDGTGLETIIAPKPGIVAANGDWTPDGKSIFFISTDNPQRTPELRQIDLATRTIRPLPTPAGLHASDPHRLGDRLVFPAKAGAKGADPLWIMNVDGTAARQLTKPPRSSSADGLYGDFDPKLSPDGTKVAFMRIDGGLTWRVMVLDLKSGDEKRLSPPDGMEWLPTWSGDGKLLLFTRVDTKNVNQTGLYTMNRDGGDRRKVPLPPGLYYNHGTFFPGEKASPSARIIFSASKRPWL
jgi:hypothetical protein